MSLGKLDRVPLAAQFAAVVSLITVLVVVASLLATERLLTARQQASFGQALQGLAVDFADRLDRGMYERFRDILTVARLDPLFTGGDAATRQRRVWLDELHRTFPAYAWIGFADTQGIVRASTGGLLEGQSVAQRPWYQGALKGPFVGDLHEAKLLANFLAATSDGEPHRFVDVAAPIHDAQGRPVGVVGAHLSWSWADDLRTALLAPNDRFRQTEVLILDAAGQVVLGWRFGTDLSGTPVVAALARQPSGFLRDASGGTDMLVGFARTKGHLGYPGLGWSVVTRTPVSVAFAPVRELQSTLLLIGVVAALSGILFGAVAAGRITRPIRRLTDEAQRIGRDAQVTALSKAGGAREVVLLSQALRSLLRRVGTYAQSLEQAERRTGELASANAHLRELATTDPLTGLLNRRAFTERAQQELVSARRHADPLSVAVIDIDRFKRINDTHGHAVGDAAIRALADVCRRVVRETDVVARFGGEEFVVLLPRTGETEAVRFAERLRAAVEATPIEGEGVRLSMTVSVGCAELAGPADDLERAIERADQALYDAKNGGRNTVRFTRAEALAA